VINNLIFIKQSSQDSSVSVVMKVSIRTKSEPVFDPRILQEILLFSKGYRPVWVRKPHAQWVRKILSQRV